METLTELVTANPWITSIVLAVLAALAPLGLALRRALIRRVDQAWPDDRNDMSYDQKVQHTVKHMGTTLMPDSIIDRTVRRHKK